MTYLYKHEATGQVHQRTQSMHETVPAQLEIDGVVYLRVWEVPPVHFRGEGFSINDRADPITKWQREYAN